MKWEISQENDDKFVIFLKFLNMGALSKVVYLNRVTKVLGSLIKNVQMLICTYFYKNIQTKFLSNTELITSELQ